MKPQVVLIGGTGRSGTNILKSILSKHSMVEALPFEHRFIIDPDGIVDYYTGMSETWSPYMADRKIRRLENYLLGLSRKKILDIVSSQVLRIFDSKNRMTRAYYHGWQLDRWFPNYEKHVKTMLSRLKDFEFSGNWPGSKPYVLNSKMYFSAYKDRPELALICGDFLNSCIADLLNRNSKQIFVEDNTWNILMARELFEILPQAKLISIIRDPRDTVASMVRQKWCPSRLDQAIDWYLSILNRWLIIRKRLTDAQYIEIRLEDLVKEPRKILKSLCGFISVPMQEAMFTLNLDKSNNGRWISQFDKTEKKILSDRLTQACKALGYDHHVSK